jgi:two-component system chemotaxis sensor kinase CheA
VAIGPADRVLEDEMMSKGTAGFLGYDPVVKLSHRAEDVLNSLRRGEVELSRRMIDILLRARDQLVHMLDDIRDGGLKEYDLAAMLAELEAVQQSASPALRLGEMLVADGVIAPETLHEALQVQATSSQPKKLGQVLVDQGLASAADVGNALVQQRQTTESSTATSSTTMRVDVRKLDELINLIGELVLERNRLTQLSRDVTLERIEGESLDTAFSQSAARLSFITEELQVAGLRTRMVPIDSLFRKFPRLVRDVAHNLQKEVNLMLQGEETKLDKTMVELVGDPLVHLVRNSLDHGVESPEIRSAAGKSRRGTIRLEACQEGDQILITVADDGAGIDPDRVARKAVEKGLTTTDRVRTMSPKEILDFIFLPGFSTAEKVSDISGRDVGMDVVRTNLKKLNGTVELDSHLGLGTTVLLRLPLTLAVLPVLLVQVGDEIYALPLRSVLETARVERNQVHTVEGREVLCLRGETLPLMNLARIFATKTDGKGRSANKVVVLGIGNQRVALLVDELVAQESTVIKPLNSQGGSSIAGATISGDGRVRLVLDPAALLTCTETPTALKENAE